MSDYDNTGRGVLFQNTRKEKETDSDYNGEINIDGEIHWLNGWKNTSKTGTTYLSLSIGKVKEQRQVVPMNDIDDEVEDIPF